MGFTHREIQQGLRERKQIRGIRIRNKALWSFTKYRLIWGLDYNEWENGQAPSIPCPMRYLGPKTQPVPFSEEQKNLEVGIHSVE